MVNTLSVIDTVDSPFTDFFCNQKSYLQNRITLGDISQRLNLSSADILFYIKYTHGFNSFSYMVHWYRIADAMDMWREEPELSVKEIARSVGYYNSIVFLYWLSRIKG